jgi:hypothetical protein
VWSVALFITKFIMDAPQKQIPPGGKRQRGDEGLSKFTASVARLRGSLILAASDQSTEARKPRWLTSVGRTHLRKFASRRKARRTNRPRYRSPSFTLPGMVGRASPCPGAAPPRSLISSRSRGDRYGQLGREAPNFSIVGFAAAFFHHRKGRVSTRRANHRAESVRTRLDRVLSPSSSNRRAPRLATPQTKNGGICSEFVRVFPLTLPAGSYADGPSSGRSIPT